MTPTNTIDDDLRDELEAVARSVGCELLSAEFAGNVFRIVLDRDEGSVTVDDCSTVSRQVSALLDVMDFGLGKYTLEVSSPGLDRPLLKPRDYRRFTGRLAKITYEIPERGTKKTVTGRLEGFDEADEIVSFIEEGTDGPIPIPLARIARAHLEVEL